MDRPHLPHVGQSVSGLGSSSATTGTLLLVLVLFALADPCPRSRRRCLTWRPSRAITVVRGDPAHGRRQDVALLEAASLRPVEALLPLSPVAPPSRLGPVVWEKDLCTLKVLLVISGLPDRVSTWRSTEPAVQVGSDS